MEPEQLHHRLCRESHEHGHKGFKVDPKQMYPLLGSNPMVIINVCFSLMAVGDMLLILLLGTLLWSPRARVRRRNASLINLLVVTILASVPPALLYVSQRHPKIITPDMIFHSFYGQQILNKCPPHILCFTQAILKHGTDSMYVLCSSPSTRMFTIFVGLSSPP